MTTYTSLLGLPQLQVTDNVADTIAIQNTAANTLDSIINVQAVTSFPPNPYDNQWVWYTYGTGTGGLYRYEKATNKWRAVRSPNTARGYMSQQVNGSVSWFLISGGGTGNSSQEVNSIAVPYKANTNYGVVSQGNLMLLGTQAANTTIDVHHYLIPITAANTNPPLSNSLLTYQYQEIDSSSVGQRIPFYIQGFFDSESLLGGTYTRVAHCIQIDLSQLSSGAQLGIDSTTAANNLQKMFFYDYGADAFG